jgi:DNA end-binding protein Ku
MPTAVWTGSLSFGLVNVPVRLITATEPKDVRFHLYDAEGRRVRYRRVVDDDRTDAPDRADREASPSRTEREERRETEDGADDEALIGEPAPRGGIPTERDVAWEEVYRGRETDAGEVVLLSPDEIEQVRPERSRTIDVEDFVDLRDIDPVYFEKTYYAIPRDEAALRPYELLHAALERAGRVGIGRFVLRTKPHLVAVRPMQDVLAVETLFFGDEVREAKALAPFLSSVEIDERQLDLAEQLIETLKTEWDPAAYADTYREELLRLLAEKETTAPPAERPAAATATGAGSQVEELMAALRESVEAAKAKTKPPRSRSTKAKAKAEAKAKTSTRKAPAKPRTRAG